MNNAIFYFFNSIALQVPILDKIIWFLAVPFIYIVIALVIIYFLKYYRVFDFNNSEPFLKKFRGVIVILFSTGLSYALASALKLLIHTERPFTALPGVHTLFAESGYAFPSGHSATIAAFAFAVFFRHKRLGYLCMLFALLIGIARVASGVHFPLDILGGYILGFMVAFFTKTL